MPVNYAPLVLALAVWVVGCWLFFRRLRARQLTQHHADVEGPLPLVRTFLPTLLVGILLAAILLAILAVLELTFG